MLAALEKLEALNQQELPTLAEVQEMYAARGEGDHARGPHPSPKKKTLETSQKVEAKAYFLAIPVAMVLITFKIR